MLCTWYYEHPYSTDSNIFSSLSYEKMYAWNKSLLDALNVNVIERGRWIKKKLTGVCFPPVHLIVHIHGQLFKLMVAELEESEARWSRGYSHGYKRHGSG